MPSLIFRGVAFAFADALPLFEDVSLRLSPGIHGIVGENGGGKTTLLRLAAAQLAPDRGTIHSEPAGALVAYCPQTVDVLGDDIRAFAAAGDGAALALRGMLSLDPTGLERWSTLSPGERRRWQLAAALHSEPDVLLADEPTNHLDGDARYQVIAALAGFRGTALVVSHDRALLDAVTQSTLRVHNAGVEVYALPYSEARAAWEREAEARATERETRKEDHAAAARKLAEARDRRARADQERSSSRRMKNRNDHDARSMGRKVVIGWAEGRLGRLVGARKSELERAAAAIPAFAGARAVGRSIFVGYEPSPRAHVLRLDVAELRAGARVLLRDVHVAVARNARVHIAGPNGAGKSTLVNALVASATLPPDKLLCLPQEIDPAAAVELLKSARKLPPEERGRTLSLVAALGVDPDRLLASRAPSPGEARKLAIALGLARRVHALILDEPTNHLDLPSIERIEAALEGYPGALVIVSHDDNFAAQLATEQWRLEGDRITGGGFADGGVMARREPRPAPGTPAQDRPHQRTPRRAPARP